MPICLGAVILSTISSSPVQQPFSFRVADVQMFSPQQGWAVDLGWQGGRGISSTSSHFFQYVNGRWQKEELSSSDLTLIDSFSPRTPTDGWAVGDALVHYGVIPGLAGLPTIQALHSAPLIDHPGNHLAFLHFACGLIAFRAAGVFG